MANDYVTIAEGTGGMTKRFKAVEMAPRVSVTRNIRETVEGSADIAYGGSHKYVGYIFRVPYTVTDTSYGTYSDICTMIGRNNPNGSPPTRFTFTDHYGATHTSSFFTSETGNIQPLSVIIDTENAWYMVQAEIYLGS